MTRSVFKHRRGLSQPWNVGTLLSADTLLRGSPTSTLGTTDGSGSLDPLTWTERRGGWAIDANGVYLDVSTGRSSATVPIGVANVAISLQLSVIGALGICARWSDTSNFLLVRYDAAQVQLRRYESGFLSANMISTAWTATVGDELHLLANGSTLAVWVNDVHVGTTTSTFNQTATTHGLYADNDTVARATNWSAYTP